MKLIKAVSASALVFAQHTLGQDGVTCRPKDGHDCEFLANQQDTDGIINDIKASQQLLGVAGQQSEGAKPRFGLKVNIPAINYYGCWCYGGGAWPGAKDRSGSGKTVDLFDDACKAHHMGFDCITMDAKYENKDCTPNVQTYDLKVTQKADGDYFFECSNTIENDWCKRRVCMVDLRFLARIWKLKDDGLSPDFTSYGHPGHHNGEGDYDTDQCRNWPSAKGPGHNPPIVQVCCGEYPYRIWYDVNNSKNIQCCEYEDPAVTLEYDFPIKVGKLYNGLSATCCADRVVSGSNVCT